MKSFFISIFFLVNTVMSCSNGSEDEITLVGSYKFIEILADPGDGSGTFMPVNSSKVLNFYSNGLVTSNGSICTMSPYSDTNSKGTYSKINNTLTSESCKGITINFELNETTLILIYPCIEPCKEKYLKIE